MLNHWTVKPAIVGLLFYLLAQHGSGGQECLSIPSVDQAGSTFVYALVLITMAFHLVEYARRPHEVHLGSMNCVQNAFISALPYAVLVVGLSIDSAYQFNQNILKRLWPGANFFTKCPTSDGVLVHSIVAGLISGIVETNQPKC